MARQPAFVGGQKMDVSLTNPTGRKFPSMTTDDLKIAVVDLQFGLNPNCQYMTAVQIADKIGAMKEEVWRRSAGLSKTLHQILNR
jgi:hypothetical protein